MQAGESRNGDGRQVDRSTGDGMSNDAKPNDTGPNEARPNDVRPGRPEPTLQDVGIRIARDGTWYHAGTAFQRPALVKLFASVLRRAEDGTYMLVTPVERGRVEVEDAPFVAVEMVVEGEGAGRTLRFRTNVDDWVTADADHPIRVETAAGSDEPSPYVLVRKGLEARIQRAVFYDLVELAEEEDGMLVVRSAGAVFPLGPAVDIEEDA